MVGWCTRLQLALFSRSPWELIWLGRTHVTRATTCARDVDASATTRIRQEGLGRIHCPPSRAGLPAANRKFSAVSRKSHDCGKNCEPQDAHAATLSAANSAQSEEFRQVSEQRDKLAEQLRDAEQSYQVVQAELTALRAEHDRVLLRTTSLESKVDELNSLHPRSGTQAQRQRAISYFRPRYSRADGCAQALHRRRLRCR